jgi:hypothetical protein
MLSVIRLSHLVLNAVMLSVVAPHQELIRGKRSSLFVRMKINRFMPLTPEAEEEEGAEKAQIQTPT